MLRAHTAADMGTALPQLRKMEAGRASLPIEDQSPEQRAEFDQALAPLADLGEPKFLRPDMELRPNTCLDTSAKALA